MEPTRLNANRFALLPGGQMSVDDDAALGSARKPPFGGWKETTPTPIEDVRTSLRLTK